jgi:hypothetical protein
MGIKLVSVYIYCQVLELQTVPNQGWQSVLLYKRKMIFDVIKVYITIKNTCMKYINSTQVLCRRTGAVMEWKIFTIRYLWFLENKSKTPSQILILYNILFHKILDEAISWYFIKTYQNLKTLERSLGMCLFGYWSLYLAVGVFHTDNILKKINDKNIK